MLANSTGFLIGHNDYFCTVSHIFAYLIYDCNPLKIPSYNNGMPFELIPNKSLSKGISAKIKKIGKSRCNQVKNNWAKYPGKHAIEIMTIALLCHKESFAPLFIIPIVSGIEPLSIVWKNPPPKKNDCKIFGIMHRRNSEMSWQDLQVLQSVKSTTRLIKAALWSFATDHCTNIFLKIISRKCFSFFTVLLSLNLFYELFSTFVRWRMQSVLFYSVKLHHHNIKYSWYVLFQVFFLILREFL